MGNNYKHIFEEETMLRLRGNNNNNNNNNNYNDTYTPLPPEAGLFGLL
jgi:hypothetical protein